MIHGPEFPEGKAQQFAGREDLVVSPEAVVEYLECRHRLTLWLAALAGSIPWPPATVEPSETALFARIPDLGARPVLLWRGEAGKIGAASHEARKALAEAREETLASFARREDRLIGPVLWEPPWVAMPDALMRVEAPSRLGPYRYDVVKVVGPEESRIDALVTAALEADLLSGVQGASPAIQLWASGTCAHFPFEHAAAYVRRLKQQMRQDLLAASSSYPHPVAACKGCEWRAVCDARRRQDDHLVFVAEITRAEMRALEKAGIRTLAALAETTETEVPGLSALALERLKRQAQIQRQARLSGRPVFRRRDGPPGGRSRALPSPSPADLFVAVSTAAPGSDSVAGWTLEWAGPMASGASGVVRRMATAPAEEPAVLLEFLECANGALTLDPAMHVYHFGPDLPDFLKRLSGRHGLGEALLDRLLRAQVFVDLKAYVRETLWVSEEVYSLSALVRLVAASGTAEGSSPALLADAEATPAAALAGLYRALIAETPGGAEEPRDHAGASLKTASLRVSAEEARTERLKSALLAEVPSDPAAWTAEHQARWLLSELIRWHRREERAEWWQYFANLEMDPEEALESAEAIEGLTLVRYLGVMVELEYPPQEHKLKVGDRPVDRETGRTAGEITALDPLARRLILELPEGARVPRTLAVPKPVETSAMKEAVAEVAQAVVEYGLTGPGPYRALRRLLVRELPHLRGVTKGARLRAPGESASNAARRLALALEETVLPIQGPPGTGKTYTGAHVILDLVRAGRRVGVTAVSHQVISHLVDQVAQLAQQEGVRARIVQKTLIGSRAFAPHPGVGLVYSNQGIYEAFREGHADVVAGTAWLFSRAEWRDALDVLVIDEAGQFALAQALAVGTAARSLILLGDPQQLAQPTQGHHPPGVDISVLEHVLGQEDTIREDQGIFLDLTYRMHPAVSEYISHIAYDGRLQSHPRCALQSLDLEPPWPQAGLAWVPVGHDGNRTVAPEEARAIQAIVGHLLGRRWHSASGEARSLGWDDVLVVAPFNAQVAYLKSLLPKAHVGTVDKFQGQEAPVVIYSMTASTAEDAPHGSDFLYSLNRLNVAISRAQGLAILVANPALLLAKPETPEQLRVLNALCRFVEKATEIPLEAGQRP
ncbi:MAG: TM0106 family RecB-like putative nuclease [Firmicutes bacterium]|nr:TM0106 family RecB-like putative nuclease [Bacillota bacterium]